MVAPCLQLPLPRAHLPAASTSAVPAVRLLPLQQPTNTHYRYPAAVIGAVIIADELFSSPSSAKSLLTRPFEPPSFPSGSGVGTENPTPSPPTENTRPCRTSQQASVVSAVVLRPRSQLSSVFLDRQIATSSWDTPVYLRHW